MMKLGMAVAFIGALIAFVAMIFAWNGDIDDAPLVGADMAVAMMFFAVGGCFSAYSPVKASTILVLTVLAIAFSIVAAYFGAMMIVFAVILVILGFICIVFANSSGTKDYVETNRII